MARLEVERLNAGYGRARALFDLDLRLASGEVVALLGRNGAGKSTALKAIMGLLQAVSGTIRLNGETISGLPAYQIARRGVGYVPEDRRIFTDLTVAENLEVGRRPPRAGAPHWTRERLLELFPSLARMQERPAAQMSGGEQQMLSIARTLAGNPGTVLLDEPSEGLAPLVVGQIAVTIGELKRAGLTVLLAEQNPRFAARVADRAYILEKGRIVREARLP